MVTMTEEVWLPIEETRGYDISNLGRIRSYHARCGGARVILDSPQRILKQQKLKIGYLTHSFWVDGKRKVLYTHRLVAKYFIGPCPEGQEVRHKDGDRVNNVWTNLCYGTRHDNVQDMVRHGRANQGERCPQHKLTESQIRYIRQKHSEIHKIKPLAEEFGVWPVTIWKIVSRNSWKHVV